MKAIRKQPTFEVQLGDLAFSFLLPGAGVGVELYRHLLTPLQKLAGASAESIDLAEIGESSAAMLACTWNPEGPFGALDVVVPPIKEWTREVLLAVGREALAEFGAAGLTFQDVQALSIAVSGRVTGGDKVEEVLKIQSFTEASPG